MFDLFTLLRKDKNGMMSEYYLVYLEWRNFNGLTSMVFHDVLQKW